MNRGGTYRKRLALSLLVVMVGAASAMTTLSAASRSKTVTITVNGLPPKTYAQVRTDAKQIAGLGDGTVGYGDYSKSNTGGWHFTAELYSLGGSIAVRNGKTWRAAFNNALGKQVLQQLKSMRWADKSMG